MPLKYRHGFTIIELLVALLIIGFLLGAASLSFTAAKRSSRDAHRIGDILVIGRAIDQSVTLGRGAYPINMKYTVSGTQPSNNLLMCADEIVSDPANTMLDLSLFTGRSVPTDPSPEMPRVANLPCAQQEVSGDLSAFVKYGYIYHTEYGHTTYPDYLAAKQKVTYSLEVLLEGDKPIDEQLLKSPSELGNAFNSNGSVSYTTTLGGRSRFIYNGNYCGDSCYK